MNKPTTHKRPKILSVLVESTSMRFVSRLEDLAINAVSELLVDAGEAYAVSHDGRPANAPAKHVQSDEIWSFCYAKGKDVPKAVAAPQGADDIRAWTLSNLSRLPLPLGSCRMYRHPEAVLRSRSCLDLHFRVTR